MEAFSSFLYLPADDFIAAAPNVPGVFSNAARSGWFEGGRGDENNPGVGPPFAPGTQRMLRFTMRSGTVIDSPLIFAGRAPTFIQLHTGLANQPRLMTGRSFWDDKTIPATRVTGDVDLFGNSLFPVVGNFGFNRQRVIGDEVTNIEFDATDVNQTSFRALWLELSDDLWPFGDPNIVSGGDGDRWPLAVLPALALPGPTRDDFPPGGGTRQYADLGGGINDFLTNPGLALNLPPVSPGAGVPINNITFNHTLFDLMVELDTPGDAEVRADGVGFSVTSVGGVWTAGTGVPGIINVPGAGAPAEDGVAAGVHAQGDHNVAFTSAVRSSRQVVLETLFGQASSYREIVNPANAKVLSVSTLWDFHNITLTNPRTLGGAQPLNVGRMAAGESNRDPLPAGGVPPIMPYGGLGGRGYNYQELDETFGQPPRAGITFGNGYASSQYAAAPFGPWLPVNSQTVTFDAAGANGLIITAPGGAPIAGGVRALRFFADHNQSVLTIEHNAWNSAGNAGIQINRALEVSDDLTQIGVSGAYIREQIRREAIRLAGGVGQGDALHPGMRGSFTTVFSTPMSSMVTDSTAMPPVVLTPWVFPNIGANGGGLWIEVITGAYQDGDDAALTDEDTPHNIIGPIGSLRP